jgi:hypothetical protein
MPSEIDIQYLLVLELLLIFNEIVYILKNDKKE